MFHSYVSSTVYDGSVNAQSLKIKKIWITQNRYQSDPLSFSADLGMEEKKKKGGAGCGIYSKVFYTLPAPLFEPVSTLPCCGLSRDPTREGNRVPNLSGNFPLQVLGTY